MLLCVAPLQSPRSRLRSLLLQSPRSRSAAASLLALACYACYACCSLPYDCYCSCLSCTLPNCSCWKCALVLLLHGARVCFVRWRGFFFHFLSRETTLLLLHDADALAWSRVQDEVWRPLVTEALARATTADERASEEAATHTVRWRAFFRRAPLFMLLRGFFFAFCLA